MPSSKAGVANYRWMVVPLRSVTEPDEATQARAFTALPTAGIPLPFVEAAVTLPVKEYSVPFVPHLFGVTVDADVSPMVVVAPLLLHVRLPPPARLLEGAVALL